MSFKCGCACSLKSGAVALFAAGALAATAEAAPEPMTPVFVQNHSFELPVTNWYVAGAGPSWTASHTGSGYEMAQIWSTGYNSIVPPTDGISKLSLVFNKWSAAATSATFGITQDLGRTVNTGDVYSLTVAAANHPYDDHSLLVLELRAGGVTVASQTFDNLPAAVMADYSISYTALSPAPAGNLSIYLGVTDSSEPDHMAVFLDNVRVSAVVPEPTMLLAPLSIAWLMQRRRFVSAARV